MCIRDSFQANHDWYVRAVREPLLDLADALGDTVRAIDPELETRPGRVLCRPNRDIRYSRDKSVYRDYMSVSYTHLDGRQAGRFRDRLSAKNVKKSCGARPCGQRAVYRGFVVCGRIFRAR